MSLKLKRHYRLFVMLALVAAVLILGLGDQRIVAYTVQDNGYKLAMASVLGSIAQHSAYLSNTPLLVDLASGSR